MSSHDVIPEGAGLLLWDWVVFVVRSKKGAHCHSGSVSSDLDLPCESWKESRHRGVGGVPFLTFMTSRGSSCFIHTLVIFS